MYCSFISKIEIISSLLWHFEESTQTQMYYKKYKKFRNNRRDKDKMSNEEPTNKTTNSHKSTQPPVTSKNKAKKRKRREHENEQNLDETHATTASSNLQRKLEKNAERNVPQAIDTLPQTVTSPVDEEVHLNVKIKLEDPPTGKDLPKKSDSKLKVEFENILNGKFAELLKDITAHIDRKMEVLTKRIDDVNTTVDRLSSKLDKQINKTQSQEVRNENVHGLHNSKCSHCNGKLYENIMKEIKELKGDVKELKEFQNDFDSSDLKENVWHYQQDYQQVGIQPKFFDDDFSGC